MPRLHSTAFKKILRSRIVRATLLFEIFLIIVSLLSFAQIYFFTQERKSATITKLKIIDPDPELALAVEKGAMSSFDWSDATYYSPSLKLNLTINRDFTTINEWGSSITLSFNSVPESYVELLRNEQPPDILREEIKLAIQNSYTDFALLEEVELDGYDLLKLKYTRRSLTEDRNETLFATYFFRTIGTTTLYAQLKSLDEESPEEGELEQIIRNASEPETDNRDTTIGLAPNYSVTFSTDRWSITDLSHSYVDLELFNPEQPGSVKIVVGGVSGDTLERLSKDLQQELTFANASYQNYDFRLLTDVSEISYGQNSFIGYEYAYSNSFGESVRVSHLIKKDEAQNRSLHVYIESRSSEPILGNDFQELLRDLVFPKADAQEADNKKPKSIDLEKTGFLALSTLADIYSRACVELTISNEASFSTLAGKSYKICSATLDSGLYINENGYIIASQVTTTPSLSEILNQGVFAKADSNSLLLDLSQELYIKLVESQPNVNAESIETNDLIADSIVRYLNQAVRTNEIKANQLTYENYLLLGNSININVDDFSLLNRGDHIKLELISQAQSYNSNLSMLKVASDSGVKISALQMAESYQPDSDTIFIISRAYPELNGYPSLTTETSTSFDRATLSSSYGGKRQVQPINGNPTGFRALYNSDGEVIGISLGGGSDLIDRELLRDFAEKNGTQFKQSEGSIFAESGFDAFGKGFYLLASKELRKAVAMTPDSDLYTKLLLKNAEQKVGEGGDLSPISTLFDLYITKYNVHYAIICTVSSSLAILNLALLIILVRRRLSLHRR